MTDVDYSRYRPLMAEALDAYRNDSSYAEDMAKQAGLLHSRQAARDLRNGIDTESLAS